MSTRSFWRTGTVAAIATSFLLAVSSWAVARGGPGTGYAGAGSFGINTGVPNSPAKPTGARSDEFNVPRANPGWSAGRTFINPRSAYRDNNPSTDVRFTAVRGTSSPPSAQYWDANVPPEARFQPVGAGTYENAETGYGYRFPAAGAAVNPQLTPRMAYRVGNYWATRPRTDVNYYGSYWPWYRFGASPGYYAYDFGYAYPYGLNYNYTVPYVTDYGYSYPYATGDDVSNYPYDMPPYTADYAVARPMTETVTSGDVQPPTVIGTTTPRDYMGEATAAFQNGDYGNAVRLASHASLDEPRNPNTHLIQSLGYLAMGQYRSAAAEAHAVASLGDVPNWPVVYQLYGSVEPFTAQLRSLEKFVRDNPMSADGRLLLVFQYLVTGHRDAANPQFLLALESTPRDRIAADLLTKAGGIVPPEIASELSRPPSAGTVDQEPRTARRPALTPVPVRPR
ncbi:MAG: hypothetical protein LLG00_00450 [Planctomycetaceae bacterium]|nr:hypothetical protein [Planctomycetaceae bacterium]